MFLKEFFRCFRVNANMRARILIKKKSYFTTKCVSDDFGELRESRICHHNKKVKKEIYEIFESG